VKPKIRQQLANRKRRIERRLDKTNVPDCQRPMFTASDIHYEVADRRRGDPFQLPRSFRSSSAQRGISAGFR
jgi:hypothetical protein